MSYRQLSTLASFSRISSAGQQHQQGLTRRYQYDHHRIRSETWMIRASPGGEFRESQKNRPPRCRTAERIRANHNHGERVLCLLNRLCRLKGPAVLLITVIQPVLRLGGQLLCHAPFFDTLYFLSKKGFFRLLLQLFFMGIHQHVNLMIECAKLPGVTTPIHQGADGRLKAIVRRP